KSTAPEVVISHIHRTNVMTILAVGRGPVPVIIVEHNEPGMGSSRKVWDTLRRLTYPRARKLVSVSRGVDRHFSWLPETKRTSIHNPLPSNEGDAADTRSTPESPSSHKLITAMGRLTAQKGFDLLLQAFSRIADCHPDWNLTVIGDGELRAELERLRDE